MVSGVPAAGVISTKVLLFDGSCWSWISLEEDMFAGRNRSFEECTPGMCS